MSSVSGNAAPRIDLKALSPWQRSTYRKAYRKALDGPPFTERERVEAHEDVQHVLVEQLGTVAGMRDWIKKST